VLAEMPRGQAGLQVVAAADTGSKTDDETIRLAVTLSMMPSDCFGAGHRPIQKTRALSDKTTPLWWAWGAESKVNLVGSALGSPVLGGASTLSDKINFFRRALLA
jgi:hypothetical protein